MSYVKINIPDKLKKKVIDTISNISSTHETKIKKGMNEVTKSIERGIAKLVIIAEDVDPPEVVFHLPLLCDEKNIPYIYVNTKKDLGKAVGLKIDTSSLAIIIPGEDNVAAINDIISQVNKLK